MDSGKVPLSAKLLVLRIYGDYFTFLATTSVPLNICLALVKKLEKMTRFLSQGKLTEKTITYIVIIGWQIVGNSGVKC
jgi:hypothetical protein